MASQTMLAGMKVSITGSQNSHVWSFVTKIGTEIQPHAYGLSGKGQKNDF